jgi:hypothetical protein
MHQTLLKLRISQEEAAMKIITQYTRREEHFTEGLSPRSPMNFNDYLNLRRMKTKTI